ncbi:hypothetical protein [Streptomyces sp. NPDC001927]
MVAALASTEERGDTAAALTEALSHQRSAAFAVAERSEGEAVAVLAHEPKLASDVRARLDEVWPLLQACRPDIALHAGVSDPVDNPAELADALTQARTHSPGLVRLPLRRLGWRGSTTSPTSRRSWPVSPRIFDAGRDAFQADEAITGAQLYAEVERPATDAGWEIGIWHAGHLVGDFPHETNEGAKAESYITPENTNPLRRTDRSGRRCHWILELHFVNGEKGFGGFFEQLLDLG